MKTNSTYWSRMESEAQQMRNKAKKKLRSYERQVFFTTYKKRDRGPIIKKQTTSCIPQKMSKSFSLMHRSSKLEDAEAINIQNKMSYLRMSRDRKINHSQELRKQCKIVQMIRDQSKKEKQFHSQEIENSRTQDKMKNQDIVKTSRYEREKVLSSRQQFAKQKNRSASEIRTQKKINESRIKIDKTRNQNKNKFKVQQVKLEQRLIHSKLNEVKSMMIDSGKLARQKKIQHQYSLFMMKKRKNEKSMNKLIEESKKILEQKRLAEENLLKMRDFLHLSRRSRRSSLKEKEQKMDERKATENIFHLTH